MNENPINESQNTEINQSVVQQNIQSLPPTENIVNAQQVQIPTSQEEHLTMSEKLQNKTVENPPARQAYITEQTPVTEQTNISEQIIEEKIDETKQVVENIPTVQASEKSDVNKDKENTTPLSRILAVIGGAIVFGLVFGGGMSLFITISNKEEPARDDSNQEKITEQKEVILVATSLDGYLLKMNSNSYKIKNEGSIIYPLEFSKQGLAEAQGQGEIYYGVNEFSYFKEGVMVAEDAGYYRGYIDETGVRYSIIDSEESYFQQPSQFGSTKNYSSVHPLVKLIEDLQTNPERINSSEQGLIWEWHHTDPQVPNEEVLFTVEILVEEDLVVSMNLRLKDSIENAGDITFEYSDALGLEEFLKIPEGYRRSAQVQQAN